MAVARSAVGQGEVASVDHIRLILDRLVAERQRLRLEHAGQAELEANRLAIAYWQRRLGATLAARARAQSP